MIRVLFNNYRTDLHSMYSHLLECPPAGVKFSTVTGNKQAINKVNIVYHNNTKFRKLIVSLYKHSSMFINPSYLRALIEKKFQKIPENTDLIYSPGGKWVLHDIPWVVELETVAALYKGNPNFFRLHKRGIEKILASKNCKKILPWTEEGKRSILLNLNTKRFHHKINVVPLAIKSIPFKRSYNNKEIRILFMGSANKEFQYNFYMKGGLEAILAFKKIEHKYDNIKLTLRCVIPENIKPLVKNDSKIEIIGGILPREEFEEILKTTDVFLFPAFTSPGMSFLEAMNFGIPIITTDFWANKEQVYDGKNGFLVPQSTKVDCFHRQIKNVPRVVDKDLIKHQPDYIQIKIIAQKLSQLIENTKLRERMGKYGKKLIESGNFSIGVRNKRLKTIFEESVGK